MLYGIIIKPANFDPAKTYPVVEAIYNGPQVVTTPHTFAQSATNDRDMTELGFVVVKLDSRGSPMRSKAFQDYAFNNMQEFGLEDHVAVFKQLAAERPWMDMSRLGVFGHSFGGYACLKAMLGYPDVYKAGACSAGPYDPYSMYPLDAYFEPPVFKGDRTKPDEHPANWGNIDLTREAARLKGDLLIAYGDLDANAFPAAAVRLVQALEAANKSFELIEFPNGTHAFSSDPYYIRRRWDFLVRALQHAEPPHDYVIGKGAQ